jgi:hypothetical protein
MVLAELGQQGYDFVGFGGRFEDERFAEIGLEEMLSGGEAGGVLDRVGQVRHVQYHGVE